MGLHTARGCLIIFTCRQRGVVTAAYLTALAVIRVSRGVTDASRSLAHTRSFSRGAKRHAPCAPVVLRSGSYTVLGWSEPGRKACPCRDGAVSSLLDNLPGSAPETMATGVHAPACTSGRWPVFVPVGTRVPAGHCARARPCCRATPATALWAVRPTPWRSIQIQAGSVDVCPVTESQLPRRAGARSTGERALTAGLTRIWSAAASPRLDPGPIWPPSRADSSAAHWSRQPGTPRCFANGMLSMFS